MKLHTELMVQKLDIKLSRVHFSYKDTNWTLESLAFSIWIIYVFVKLSHAITLYCFTLWSLSRAYFCKPTALHTTTFSVEFARWSLTRASTVFCKYWAGKEEWETSYVVSTSQGAIRRYWVVLISQLTQSKVGKVAARICFSIILS